LRGSCNRNNEKTVSGFPPLEETTSGQLETPLQAYFRHISMAEIMTLKLLVPMGVVPPGASSRLQ
jgi:hypothetical protein